MKIKEWKILFHPVFNEQWLQLIERVEKIKSRLSQIDFVKHPQVKLFKALTVAIEEKIPQNPKSSDFALRKPLNEYSRLKKMGLPNRYRLFFKVFEKETVIIILWLGFPRKEGDKKDCYRVFRKMIEKGQFPKSLKDIFN
jgi:toxin YhaV